MMRAKPSNVGPWRWSGRLQCWTRVKVEPAGRSGEGISYSLFVRHSHPTSPAGEG